MVQEKYIKRGNKLHGPYYYETYRDEKGRVRKRYLGKDVMESSSSPGIFIFILIAIIVLLAVVGFYGFNIIGYSIYAGGNVSTDINVSGIDLTGVGRSPITGDSIFGDLFDLIEDLIGGPDVEGGTKVFLAPGDPLTPIARWDIVPRQRINPGETMNIGVVAFSKNGIDRVEFTINGQGFNTANCDISGQGVTEIGSNTIEVREMRLNPQLVWSGNEASWPGVWEYWFPLHADCFTSDGPFTIEATVYGENGGVHDKNTYSGQVHGLGQLTFFANNGGSLPSPVAYISNSGNDDTGVINNPGAPYATIQGAVNDILALPGVTSLDGAKILFQPGTYSNVVVPYGYELPTVNEWVTIGSNGEGVMWTGKSGTMSSNYLKIENLNIGSGVEQFFQSSSDPTKTIWMKGNTIGYSMDWIGGHPIAPQWSGLRYTTEQTMTSGFYGWGSGVTAHMNFFRNVEFYNIRNDVYKDVPVSINTYINYMDPASTGHHADGIQGPDSSDDCSLQRGEHHNWIHYNMYAKDLRYQGIFTKSQEPSYNNAFVNIFLELRDPISHDGAQGGANQIGSGYNHLLLWHVTALGTGLNPGSDGQFAVYEGCSQNFPSGHYNDLSVVGSAFFEFRTNNGNLNNVGNNEFRDNHYINTNAHIQTETFGMDSSGNPVINMNTGSINFGKPLPGSPLLDNVTSPVVPADVWGMPRGSAADIGAIELNVAGLCQNDGDCQDNLWCTGADTCSNGFCVHEFTGNSRCGDGVSCTTDICNEATDSCTNTPDDLQCGDSNECSINERCDVNLGCVYEAAPLGQSCDDGILCTSSSICDDDGAACFPETLDSGLCPNPLGCAVVECDPLNGDEDGCVYSNCPCLTSSSSWQNIGLPSRSGKFNITFSATPSAQNVDGVIGFSSGEGVDYSGFAVLVRFHPSGIIDAINDNSYGAVNTVAFTPGAVYNFRLEVDVDSHTYNAYVTPEGMGEQVIAQDYGFRNTQQSVLNIDNWGTRSVDGTLSVCDVSFEERVFIEGPIVTPISRWDVVPYQRFGSPFNIGVIAFSMHDIDRVEFSVSGQGYFGQNPLTASSMTHNPRTDTYEYWVTLDPDDFSGSGQISINADVYGQDGGRKSSNPASPYYKSDHGFSTLYLRVDKNGPTREIYVAPPTSGGSDSNIGTQASPVATIHRALQLVGAGNFAGSVIYLAPGEYAISDGGFSSMGASSDNDWFTIRNDPSSGGSQENVIINARSNILDGVAFLKLQGLTLESLGAGSSVWLVDAGENIWIDNVNIIGPGRYTSPQHLEYPIGGFQGSTKYFTNTYITEVSFGLGTAGYPALVRNITMEVIGDDPFQNTPFLVNIVADDLDPGAYVNTYNWHTDCWQWQGSVPKNTIVYNYRCTRNKYQGIFVRAQPQTGPTEPTQPPSEDMAFVNVYIDLDTTTGAQNAFYRSVNHLLFWHVTLREELNFWNDPKGGGAYAPLDIYNFDVRGNSFYRVELNAQNYLVERNSDTHAPGVELTNWDSNNFESVAPFWAYSPGTDATQQAASFDSYGKPTSGSVLRNRVEYELLPIDRDNFVRDSPTDAGAYDFEGVAAGQCDFASDCPDLQCKTNKQCVSGQCVYDNLADGTSCLDDGFWCTGAETCQSGQCIGEYSGDQRCTNPSLPICNDATDSCTECVLNGDCDDNNECTQPICSGIPDFLCLNPLEPAGTQCTGGYCDGIFPGTCQECLNDGHCNDGNSCNGLETCSGNSCQAGTPISQCINGDGCCPAGCDLGNDNDCTSLDQGLVMHLPFDGNWNDVSGNGNDGSCSSNCPTLISDKDGNPNSAYNFNGQSVVVPDADSLDGLSAVTLSAWVRSDYSQNGYFTILGKTNYNTEREYRLRFEGGNTMAWFVDNQGTGLAGTSSEQNIPISSLDDGQWHLITGTWDGNVGSGNNLYLYVDGSPVSSGAFYFSNLWNGAANLGIGSAGDRQATTFFNGDIDDVRVYNRALSSNEVLELFNGEEEPPVSNDCKIGQGDSWNMTSFAQQTGQFNVSFSATPTFSSGFDGIVGLTDNSTKVLEAFFTSFSNFSTLIRFGAGFIDVRNGGNYNYDVFVPYSSGTTYYFNMTVDVPSHTYSVIVNNGTGTYNIATDYAFRTGMDNVNFLDAWGVYANNFAGNSLEICDFQIVDNSGGISYHPADSDQNGTVENGELMDYFQVQLSGSVAEINNPSLYPKYTNPDGSWNTHTIASLTYPWTEGFFPGQLWYMYQYTNDPQWRTWAQNWMADISTRQNDALSSDMGFLFYPTYVKGYELTGNTAYRDTAMQAAQTLSGRFNPALGSEHDGAIEIAPWNGDWSNPPNTAVNIDSMLNMDLLFWAAEETGDSSYYDIAIAHAKTTGKDHLRTDGSTYHIVKYNDATGDIVEKLTWQGYNASSTWARGQAWAVYGFTVAYRETGDVEFLEYAERSADYFVNNLPADKITYWDFEYPGGVTDKDSSASAITASALYELSYLTEDTLKAEVYRNASRDMIAALATDGYLAKTSDTNSIILHSIGNHPEAHTDQGGSGAGSEVDVSHSYTDMYFVEAVDRWVEGYTPIVCGDGVVLGTEICDDGNTDDSDGCSSSCQIESGWICDESNPSNCVFEDCSSCGFLGFGCGDVDCHALGSCYYDPTPLFGGDCIDLSTFCSSAPQCSDVSEEECNNDVCGLDCSWNGVSCVAEGPSCGNDIAEAGEACDGSDLNGMGCSDFGYLGGNLGCDACVFNYSDCVNITDIHKPISTGDTSRHVLPDIFDASGVVWYEPAEKWLLLHQRRFYVYDANGTLEGNTVDFTCNGFYDFEGVTTISSSSDTIIIQTENGGGVCILDADDILDLGSVGVIESFTWPTGDADCSNGVPSAGGSEGVAFVPDESMTGMCRYDGFLLAADQGAGYIYKYCINPSSSTLDCLVRWPKPTCNGIVEVAALEYDYENKLLYVGSDNGNAACIADPFNFDAGYLYTISDPNTGGGRINTFEGLSFGNGLFAYADDGTSGTNDAFNGLWLFEDDYCGDGVKVSTEVCDGNDFGIESCATQGFGGGSLTCAEDCQGFTTGNCVSPSCGDGICSGGENPLSCALDCGVCATDVECSDLYSCTTHSCNVNANGHGTCVVDNSACDCSSADIDISGDVDVLDLIAIANYFSSGDLAGDLNNDGVVDIFDLVYVATRIGPC